MSNWYDGIVSSIVTALNAVYFRKENIVTTNWSGTLSDNKVASEKLVKESIDDSVVEVVDNLGSTATTKALSAKQGKVLADRIGNAISYING